MSLFWENATILRKCHYFGNVNILQLILIQMSHRVAIGSTTKCGRSKDTKIFSSLFFYSNTCGLSKSHGFSWLKLKFLQSTCD